MRAAFERYYRTGSMNPKTEEGYRNTLKHWENLTDNPVIGDIDEVIVQHFRTAYLAINSPASFNKERRHLLAILNRLSSRSNYNPKGLGIIQGVPLVSKLNEPEPVSRIASEDDLNAIYAACRVAKWPSSCCDAPDWWRALVVFIYNTGFKRAEFTGLLTGDVDLDQATIQHKGETLPMHRAVVDHLRTIWSDREYVFEKPQSNMIFYREWSRIQTAAGLKDHYTFQDLRETHQHNISQEINGLLLESQQPSAFLGSGSFLPPSHSLFEWNGLCTNDPILNTTRSETTFTTTPK